MFIIIASYVAFFTILFNIKLFIFNLSKFSRVMRFLIILNYLLWSKKKYQKET